MVINKKLLRLCSLVLTVTCGLYVPVAMVSAESSQVFSENFEAYENYSRIFSYGADISSENTLEADEYLNFNQIYGIDNALSINSEKRIVYGESGKFDYTNPASMGKDCYSITDFDLYIEDNPTGNYDMYFTSSNDPSNYHTLLRVKQNTLQFIVKELDSNPTASPAEHTAEAGQWHHISVVLQCTDSDGNAKAVLNSVYVDGEKRFDTPQDRGRDFTKQKYYDMIRIVNRANVPKGYIDNITVRKVYSTSPDSYVDTDMAELLYELRKGEKALSKHKSLEGTYAYDALSKKVTEITKLLESGALGSDVSAYIGTLEDFILNIESNTEQYSINDISLSGKTIQSIGIKSSAQSEENADILFGFYQNNVLQNVKKVNTTIKSGENSVTFTPEITYADEITDIVIYLWTENGLKPLRKQVNLLSHIVRDDIGITVDDVRYYTDHGGVLKGNGKLYVPAENVLNLLGASLVCESGIYTATRIDGKSMTIDAADSYFLDNGTLMTRLDRIATAFGASCGYANGMITITSNYAESFSSLEDYATLLCNGNQESVSFQLTPNQDITVEEVYIRINLGHKENIFQASDISDENGFSSGWNMPLESVRVWKKADSIKDSGGIFTGSFASLRTNGKHYDVLVKLNDGNSDILAVQEKAVLLESSLPTVDSVKYDAENLLLKPTFENISYYFDSEKAQEAKVYYKKSVDDVWVEGYEPTHLTELGQYSGSIVRLEPNTSYDVKLVLDSVELTATITTWNETPAFTSHSLSDYYDGSGKLVLNGIKGTADNWIKISGGTVNGGKATEAVYITDCEYVIVDNLTITGGNRYGVHITGNSQNVRVQNCDISGYGREGIWSDITHTYRLDTDTVNYDSGVFVGDCSNTVIERCYIHDANSRTNTWQNDEYHTVHPAGASAVYAHTKDGLVIRYNDFIGNSFNRWNDAIEGAFNSSYHAGIGFDADIYGNMLYGGNDDSMELDGGSMNVRVYDNRIEQFYCGVSMAPIKIGPVYMYNNLIYNLGDGWGNAHAPIKQDNKNTQKQILVGNTIVAKEYSRAVASTIARNNIFISDSSVYPITAEADRDYNFYYGKSSKYSYGDSDIYLQKPLFADFAKGKFNLQNTSPAKGAGGAVSGFCEIGTDMGAKSTNGFLPQRPVTMSADSYHVEMKDKGTYQITFTAGEAEDKLSYSVEKSAKESWLSITGDTSGAMSEGGTYTIILTADMDQMPIDKNIGNSEFNCTILIRTENGYSIPVSISCSR